MKRDLELAIARGARAARRAGRRVVLVRQYSNPDGERTDGAPLRPIVKFLGAFDGRALAIEAKATNGKSLPVTRLRDEQISLLGLLHAAGADVRLIVYFADVDECFTVAWPEVVTFLALRWRASWPLCWFRALGEQLGQEGDGSDGAPWLVRFLDASPHPQREQAIAEMERERAAPPRAARSESAPRQRIGAAVVAGVKQAYEREKAQPHGRRR